MVKYLVKQACIRNLSNILWLSRTIRSTPGYMYYRNEGKQFN